MPFSFNISSPSTVVLPLPPSAINFALIKCALESLIAYSRAAGINTSHSCPNISLS